MPPKEPIRFYAPSFFSFAPFSFFLFFLFPLPAFEVFFQAKSRI